MKLLDYTWKEVFEHIKTNDTLIVPVGTCEQHGHHLPLNTDILVVEYFAEYLSTQTGIMIAPTMNYGVNLICDKLYSGTSNISEDTLKKMMKEAIEWWFFQGFRKFILLSYHGEPLHINALSNVGSNCSVFELYNIDYSGILEKQETVKHACEAETSLMMFLFPEKVRRNEIVDCDIDDEAFNKYVLENKLFEIDVFPGCVGYPSKATLEKGKEIDRRTKQSIIEWIGCQK